MNQVDISPFKGILSDYPAHQGSLIPMLQRVQEIYGYIPREGVTLLSRGLNIPESRIYGVITFYAQFYLTPQGKHKIQVCRGTACHVRGGKQIIETAKKVLGVKEDETSSDLLFSLETVACLGACALAPIMVIDGKVYGKITPEETTSILTRLKEDASK